MNEPNVPAAVSWPSDRAAELSDSEHQHLEQLILERFRGEVCCNRGDLTINDGDTVGELVGQSLVLWVWLIWDFSDEDAGLNHLNHPPMTALVDRLYEAFSEAGFSIEEEVLDRAPAVLNLRCEQEVESFEEILTLIAAALDIGLVHMIEGPVLTEKSV